MSADDVLWCVGALVSGASAVAAVVWLGLCVIDWTSDRIRRRVLRAWRARVAHGTWLSLRYRLGCRLLLPLIEKQYDAYRRARETAAADGNRSTADHREWMEVALVSLVRAARGQS